MIILGIILLCVAGWLFFENKITEGGRPFSFMIAGILLALGLGCFAMGATSSGSSHTSTASTPAAYKSSSSTTSSYSGSSTSHSSGTTDLQKKQQEWRKKADKAYDKGGYWRYD